MSDDLYETLKQTAIAHAKAYEKGPWNPDDVWQYRTEACTHALHPNANLPDAFKQPLDKEGFYGALHFFGSIMDTTKFEMQDIVVDVKQRKVTLFFEFTFDLKAVGEDAEVKGWNTEYMLLTEFDETGRKAKRVEEFMDSERLMTEIKSRAEKFQKLKANES